MHVGFKSWSVSVDGWTSLNLPDCINSPTKPMFLVNKLNFLRLNVAQIFFEQQYIAK